MKINKFNVSAVFYFKSGNSKKVDWLEDKLVKKLKSETQELTEGLSLEEADVFFQSKFKEWQENGTTIIRKNAKGENSIISFAEVEYMTMLVSLAKDISLDTTELKEDVSKATRSIQEHPAFKK
ncbi:MULTISPECIES: hypothetical protein [Bacillus]|uniref:Uncharacterized protein n=1 Tax=Bacillus cereus TaxID=1396 RepID=A0A9X6X2D3_BACCE|nr:MULTISPECIES: hypothetical protein [Bacillus cereus group]AKE16170.1 hypothetical protein FORC5_1633 [Bacillus cereus]KAA0767588.1 hypothetical protein DN404_22010 [Bacillus sp. TE8-1]KMQ30514.1 hypothetical protein TU58_05605 [Bacillus cereus]MCD2334839.1 hypothetical protein [Bacillus cereus]MDA2091424.1 hypothetical protein [Bacillus cereus]